MTELNTAAMTDAPQTPLDRERWLSEAKEFVTRCVPQSDPIRNRIAAYQIASHLERVWRSIQKTDFSKWRGAFAPFPEDDGDRASSGPAEAEATAYAAGGEAKQPAGPEPHYECEFDPDHLYHDHGWPDPTPEILADPCFEAIWQCDRALTDRMMGSGFREKFPAIAMTYDELAATSRLEERERCAMIADAVATCRGSTPYDSGHFQACRDIALRLR